MEYPQFNYKILKTWIPWAYFMHISYMLVHFLCIKYVTFFVFLHVFIIILFIIEHFEHYILCTHQLNAKMEFELCAEFSSVFLHRSSNV